MRRVIALVLLAIVLLPCSTVAQTHDYRAGQTVVVTVVSKPIHEAPSSTSGIVTTVVEGDLLDIVDGIPEQAEGLTWWRIYFAERDATGWLPDNVFAPTAEETESAQAEPATCWTEVQGTEVDGAAAWSAPPAQVIDSDTTYIATISTTKGEIVVELDAANAPIATNNFICLAEAGYYDGTLFHRVSEDFLIQGGDATGTGTGNPGYVVKSDPTTGNYPEGSIALANAHTDENGAQFFIAATDLTGQIPADYPVFGHVVSGQDVVVEISRSPVEVNPRGELSQPDFPIRIVSIEIDTQSGEVGPPLPAKSPTPTPEPTVAVAPTVVPPPTEQTLIELDAKDIAFDPTEITVDFSDGPVTIRMRNTGAAPHNFSIDALNIDVDVAPGETVDIVIPADTPPGAYDFYCNVPGHKEAGMVGTLIIETTADSSTSRSESPGTSSTDSTAPTTDTLECAGLDEYQDAISLAFLAAMLANPDAAEIFLAMDENELDDDVEFANLPPADFLTLSAFFTSLADEVEAIDPPDYASDWHETLIDGYQLTAEFLQTASAQGAELAEIIFATRFQEYDAASATALADVVGCPDFAAWVAKEF